MSPNNYMFRLYQISRHQFAQSLRGGLMRRRSNVPRHASTFPTPSMQELSENLRQEDADDWAQSNRKLGRRLHCPENGPTSCACIPENAVKQLCHLQGQ